jgi:hypothetical protein
MKSSPASSGVRPRASPSHRAVDAHSAIPLLALREGSRHQRERGRYERRPAYTLQEARNHQHPGRPRQPPKERGGGEQGEPAHEQAPPAVEVAGAAHEEQEAPEGERVSGEDPLHVTPSET